MKTILAVDGNSIINRAYFGVRPLTNGKGQRTEAIFGMVNMILSQADRVAPDSIQVAFDLHAPTFRHGMYDGYKGNRKGMDEELRSQLDPAKRVLSALGCEILSLEGYEADDILGTISATAEKNGDRVYIFTGDRDSLQLISDSTTVLLASKGETVACDPAVFFDKYGITPDRFVDAKALMGDSSDCIPGVPGIGEKTALPLIAAFGSLDGLYENLDDPSLKAGVRAKLRDFKESAYLSQTLARICREVPISLNFAPLERKPELYSILEELGFSQLISKLGVCKPEDAAAPAKKVEYSVIGREALLAIGEKCAVSLENGDLYLSGAFGNFVREAPDEETLRAFFTPERELAVFDCKALYEQLSEYGIDNFEAVDDPKLAAYVLSSGDKDYELSTLSLRYLRRTPGEEPRAALVYELTGVLTELLRADGSEKLYREIELPLAAVLSRCERVGFRIDREGIARFGDQLLFLAEQSEEQICAYAGKRFNINSPKQLGAVLFEDLGLKVPGMKKTKNGYSTNADTLEKLKKVHPIVELILDYRQLSKLRSTYTEGLLKVADGQGRVHTRFTQTVTATGRLSSIEPNLQNIPVRTELGRELRRYFTAPAGRVLIDADYSQIELRLLAAISGDETMTETFRRGVDIHTVTASQVFGVPEEDVTAEMRKRAKAVNFGIVYGISAYSLADDIKVPVWEADNYIKGYFATYPGIEKYLGEVVEKAKEEGFVTTLYGRKRYIPELTSGKGMLKKFGERVAMNSPIQGTAADLIKIAMIRVDRALSAEGLDAALILQVHDELIVEASEKDAPRAAEILRAEMEGAGNFAVPLTVDLKTGRTWFECK